MKMKKSRICALVLACLLVVVVMLSGCSSKFKSVDAYLADPDVAEQIDSEISQLEGTGLKVEVYADGNTLVYEYTYGEQLDLSDETVKNTVVEALAGACEENAETFENIAAELNKVVDASGIKVRLVYNNADGSEIYSCEFE